MIGDFSIAVEPSSLPQKAALCKWKLMLFLILIKIAIFVIKNLRLVNYHQESAFCIIPLFLFGIFQ
jgi:hypothetical protein